MQKKITTMVTGLVVCSMQLMAQDITPPYQDVNLGFHERAKDLVSRMTLEEKISQMGHGVIDIPRLGIGSYNYWNEALHGVARTGTATCFPVSRALSSTWDLPLIYDCATIISDEARIYNNIKGNGLTYWCPTINMARDPRWGREEENFGEDPYLAGKLAVEYIKGMQGDDPKYYKTIATVKHFAANNNERNRHSTTSDMDDRNLREYYLPAFEMSVKEANVRSIMSAYNRLNGVPCCANPMLLTDILRTEWGFDGFVVSDCGAIDNIYREDQHHWVDTPEEATALSIKSGEDLNCGSTFQQYCESALEKGLMTENDLDSALVRVFEARFSTGEFDPPAMIPWSNLGTEQLASEAYHQVAYRAAQEAIVLLKNDNNLLPLTTDKKVAIIGPMGNTLIQGGYSGAPRAEMQSTLLQGVAKKYQIESLDAILLQFEDYDGFKPGSNIIVEDNNSGGNLSSPQYGDWVYFDDVDFGSGRSKVDINASAPSGYESSVRIYLDDMDHEADAVVSLEATGSWNKYFISTKDIDAAKFRGKHRVYTEFLHSETSKKSNNMDWIKFYGAEGDGNVQDYGKVVYVKGCSVNDDKETDIQKAQELAQQADVVIFAAGTDLSVSDEGKDRYNLNLPGDQQKLLEAVYAVNPNVVLLMQTCSSMTINWAKENVPAIVEAWYDGQAQGLAMADVLYGDYNPSGKLTSTWYSNLGHLPADLLKYDIRANHYTYMYYNKTPLYPFGYGLSYTTFDYDNLKMSTTTLKAGEEMTISADITNSGDRKGAEVVQLYIHCNSSLERPKKQLVGFARVELEAGETTTVNIPFSHEQLAYFNDQSNTFDVENGTVDIYVASSSEDVRLSGRINAEGAIVKTTYNSTVTGIENALKNPQLKGDRVYNMYGTCVGTTDNFNALPRGLYIVNGAKRIKRIR